MNARKGNAAALAGATASEAHQTADTANRIADAPSPQAVRASLPQFTSRRRFIVGQSSQGSHRQSA
jgi:hypothetical protein